jgi:hypothetical protein
MCVWRNIFVIAIAHTKLYTTQPPKSHGRF